MDANRLEFTEENLGQCKDYLLGQGEKKSWWFDHCELNTANEVIWKENELLIIIGAGQVAKRAQRTYTGGA